MDQQPCSYATITNLIDRVKRRKPVQNQNIPKHASCLQKKGTYWQMDLKKAEIEYPFEHGEVVNIPVTTMIQASFLTQLPERKETAQGFHNE